jgi:hypothetical protein
MTAATIDELVREWMLEHNPKATMGQRAALEAGEPVTREMVQAFLSEPVQVPGKGVIKRGDMTREDVQALISELENVHERQLKSTRRPFDLDD